MVGKINVIKLLISIYLVDIVVVSGNKYKKQINSYSSYYMIFFIVVTHLGGLVCSFENYRFFKDK